MKKEKGVTLTVRISQEMSEEIRAFSERKHVSSSEAVRQIIGKFLHIDPSIKKRRVII